MFSNRNLRYTYVYSKRIIAEMESDNKPPFINEYRFTSEFINKTRFDLGIVNRQGIHTRLPAKHHVPLQEQCLYVRQVSSPKYSIESYVDDKYSVDDLGPDLETSRWSASHSQHAELKAIQYGPHRYRESSVIHTITEADIINGGYSVYLVNLDILVYVITPNNAMSPVHPFSRLGSIANVYSETMFQSDKFGPYGQTGIIYGLKIVDRNGAFGDRFLNFNDRVVRVVAERNVTVELRDGVYRTVNAGVMSSNDGQVQLETDYFTFEEADRLLPIYKSYDEAVSFGKPEDVYRRKIEQDKNEQSMLRLKAEAELVEQKRAAAEAQANFDRERANHERAMAELKEAAEKDKLEYERREREYNAFRIEQEALWKEREHEIKTETSLRKLNHEIVSSSRSESVEILKFATAALGAGLAIYAAIRKFT